MKEHPVFTRKKLIEVALPLEAINVASAREKAIRHGHPSTLHLWWARRPLATARAVIFGQMVDDPSSHPELFPTEKAQEKERNRLFKIIEDLVKWESTTDEEVLDRARAEIWQSWRSTCADNAGHPRAKELFDRHKLPAFHDPFAGGGAIPLEAQRLGLESYASDLNPVAVLINKAMIEIPPKFAGREPVNPAWQNRPTSEKGIHPWKGAHGLADDVRYYGQWMRDEAEKRIGHLYPDVEVTAEMAKERPDLKVYVGKKLKVIAWLWARTVKSPNPAFSDIQVPLASTFMLCTKAGKEAYIAPVVDGRGYRFEVKMGAPPGSAPFNAGTTAGKRGAFKCLISGVPITYDHIRQEGQAKRLRAKLMAIVAESGRGRVYLSPTEDAGLASAAAVPTWTPSGDLPTRLTGGSCVPYGMDNWGSLFTSRQLCALSVFTDLVPEARDQIQKAMLSASSDRRSEPSNSKVIDPQQYADAVAVYLAFGVDKMADRHSTLCRWDPTPTASGIINTFSRHALPMTWDFAEANPFSEASGNFEGGIGWIAKVLDLSLPANPAGHAQLAEASTQALSEGKIVSTDPPYYDNISYADISDYFYVWLRRSLGQIFPKLVTTLAVPKSEELVAVAYRHGGKDQAEVFFLTGMKRAMHQLSSLAHPVLPVTIYYAFKQSATEDDTGTTNTGWQTFLQAVIDAGFGIGGTWPVRTELSNRMIGSGTNALASSIVLVCRARAADSPTATRRELVNALRAELPVALAHLQRGNIAPVDLAQAAIGPGMAVYTRYSRVLDAEGKPLTVRHALAIINEILDEVLAEQEGDFDPETRWALVWFEENGFSKGDYGRAEILSKAKNTGIPGMARFVESKGGKVRLLKPEELAPDWDPSNTDITVWEIVHQQIRALGIGESSAAEIVAQLGARAETGRELAYRLYTICERKKRAQEAIAYNSLVQSWPEILRLAREKPAARQSDLFEVIA
ncbi:MAG: hypothetical protein JWN34_5308 [Bryobacterales bacterium]|nr:hypothetical protein [Bryobacterales bacterium]